MGLEEHLDRLGCSSVSLSTALAHTGQETVSSSRHCPPEMVSSAFRRNTVLWTSVYPGRGVCSSSCPCPGSPPAALPLTARWGERRAAACLRSCR